MKTKKAKVKKVRLTKIEKAILCLAMYVERPNPDMYKVEEHILDILGFEKVTKGTNPNPTEECMHMSGTEGICDHCGLKLDATPTEDLPYCEKHRTWHCRTKHPDLNSRGNNTDLLSYKRG